MRVAKRCLKTSRHRLPLERLESRRMLAGAVAGVGNGLVANYYAGTELSNLRHTRIDPTVDFAWADASPLGSGPVMW